MSTVSQSPLDSHRSEIIEWLAEGKSDQWISESLSRKYRVGTTRHSIRRARMRWGLKPLEGVERAAFTYSGDEAEITSKPVFQASTPEDLMHERGLNPEEWEIINLTINEWEALTAVNDDTGENEVKTLRQLKLHCKRKTPLKLIIPARMPGDYIRRNPLRVAYRENGSQLIVIASDQQFPHVDPVLQNLFLEWLDYNKPQRGIFGGDTLDMPKESKHPNNPEWDTELQFQLDGGYLMIRDTVQASPDTMWELLLGNHDERLRNYIINNTPQLYGLRRAAVPGLPVEPSIFTLNNLLRLDELGVKVHEPDGSYDYCQIKLSDGLVVRHGNTVKPKAGQTALSSTERAVYGVVMAHVHRQAIVTRTIYDANQNPIPCQSMELGCICTSDGLGYKPEPDWAQGFGTVTLWDDGSYHLELAKFSDGVLRWRDQRYS